MILLDKVSVSRNGKQLLNQVSFQATPGQITVVLGKNGAGKSTLLNCLCGQINDYQGNIDWNGQPLRSISLQEQARSRAVLAQSLDLSFNLNVFEVAEMGCYGQYQHLSRSERHQLVYQILDQLQLGAFIQRDFQSLSGGERKRVLLAKCLIQLKAGASAERQQYLLLDEPTAALDLEQQFLLLNWIKELVQLDQLGVIAVLHDLNLAAQLADQIVFLKQGNLYGCGPTAQMLQPDIIRDVFDINCLIQRHPSLDCPLITTLPYADANSAIKATTIRSKANRATPPQPAAS